MNETVGMALTLNEYGKEVEAILALNEANDVDVGEQSWEIDWIVTCYHHKDRPIQCAEGIAHIRDHLKKIEAEEARVGAIVNHLLQPWQDEGLRDFARRFMGDVSW